MIIDLARMLLFPALMAFAASSDLFTMTISNRVSLLLITGFVVLAALSGMDDTKAAISEPIMILTVDGAGFVTLARAVVGSLGRNGVTK